MISGHIINGVTGSSLILYFAVLILKLERSSDFKSTTHVGQKCGLEV